MSFDKLPIVDRFSKNEDESNVYLRQHFSQHNGFLVSKPEADKGCDFLVELIHEGMATNWRFPVQVKSMEVLRFIENDTLITYSFEVSRLRYMVESIPPVGLIILYCTGNQTLYYDYAEVILNRLMERRDGDSSWKTQRDVAIHIPASQVVNRESLAGIHQAILTRHQNSKDRSPALYPVAPSPANDAGVTVPTTPGGDTMEELKSRGMVMFYNHEIPRLVHLIDHAPLKALKEDAHLSLLAGISHWAMGNAAEASFWLDKAIDNPLITTEDQAHAEWTKLYLDMYLGKISLSEYHEQLRARLLGVPLHEEELRLRYELFIARVEVELLGPGNLAELFELPNRCLYFSHRIGATKLTAATAVEFYLQNVITLGVILIKFNLFIRRSFSDRKKQGAVIDAESFAQVALMNKNLVADIEFTLACTKKLAGNFSDKIALARCYESQVSIWLELHLSALVDPIKKIDFDAVHHKNCIVMHVSYAREALQIFMDHHHYGNALNLTRMLLELNTFADQSRVQLDIDKAALSSQADALQKKLAIPAKDLYAQKLIDAYNAIEHPGL